MGKKIEGIAGEKRNPKQSLVGLINLRTLEDSGMETKVGTAEDSSVQFCHLDFQESVWLHTFLYPFFGHQLAGCIFVFLKKKNIF